MLKLSRGDPFRPPKWAGLILAIPLTRGTPGLVLASSGAALAIGAFLMVVCPAIWSKDAKRRADAKEVLRIFRKGR